MKQQNLGETTYRSERNEGKKGEAIVGRQVIKKKSISKDRETNLFESREEKIRKWRREIEYKFWTKIEVEYYGE